MCVDWKDDRWEVAERDIVAYKIVSKTNDGKYQSPLPVEKRLSQERSSQGTNGAVLTYKPGERVESDWPGIYLLEKALGVMAPQAVLSVTIPKGTKIMRGRASMCDVNGREIQLDCINAMAVVVGQGVATTAQPLLGGLGRHQHQHHRRQRLLVELRDGQRDHRCHNVHSGD